MYFIFRIRGNGRPRPVQMAAIELCNHFLTAPRVTDTLSGLRPFGSRFVPLKPTEQW